MELSGLAELTLEMTDLAGVERFYREVVGLAALAREDDRAWLAVGVRGPVEHPGGDRSIYFADPAGNLVEAWDFLERGEAAREGVEAPA